MCSSDLAYRQAGGEAFLGGIATTDSEGNFAFSGLAPGDYFMALGEGFAFDQNQDNNRDAMAPTVNLKNDADAAGLTFYALQEPAYMASVDDALPAFILDPSGAAHIFWSRDGQIWHAAYDGGGWVDAAPVPGAASVDFTVAASSHLIDGTQSGLILTWRQTGSEPNKSEIY